MAIYYVFWPVIWLLNNASHLALWLLGLGGTDHAELAHTEEELRHIVAESVAGGHLSRSERVMIENVLNLEEKTARRVMVPRPDIVYLSLSRPLEDNLRIARQAGHTRYPLCEDDLTTVIGMIHVKDLFRAGASATAGSTCASGRARSRSSPRRSGSTCCSIEFQRNRVHLAMLLDEYGSVVGMVSLENVLEELVGPIQDEFDRETPQVTPLGDRVFEVDATCPLDVLAEACGVAVPETDAETAGGLILDLLGRLAKTGDSVTVDGHRLTVLRADPTRIRRIRVEPFAPEPQQPGHGPDEPSDQERRKAVCPRPEVRLVGAVPRSRTSEMIKLGNLTTRPSRGCSPRASGRMRGVTSTQGKCAREEIVGPIGPSRCRGSGKSLDPWVSAKTASGGRPRATKAPSLQAFPEELLF